MLSCICHQAAGTIAISFILGMKLRPFTIPTISLIRVLVGPFSYIYMKFKGNLKAPPDLTVLLYWPFFVIKQVSQLEAGTCSRYIFPLGFYLFGISFYGRIYCTLPTCGPGCETKIVVGPAWESVYGYLVRAPVSLINCISS